MTMDGKKTVEIFAKAPVPTAVLKNAVPAMAAVAQKPADPGTEPDTIPATGDPASIAAFIGLGGSAVLAAGVIARKRG